jgi:hypothetical protein
MLRLYSEHENLGVQMFLIYTFYFTVGFNQGLTTSILKMEIVYSSKMFVFIHKHPIIITITFTVVKIS